MAATESRTGFRLPWSSEDKATGQRADAPQDADRPADAEPPRSTPPTRPRPRPSRSTEPRPEAPSEPVEPNPIRTAHRSRPSRGSLRASHRHPRSRAPAGGRRAEEADQVPGGPDPGDAGRGRGVARRDHGAVPGRGEGPHRAGPRPVRRRGDRAAQERRRRHRRDPRLVEGRARPDPRGDRPQDHPAQGRPRRRARGARRPDRAQDRAGPGPGRRLRGRDGQLLRAAPDRGRSGRVRGDGREPARAAAVRLRSTASTCRSARSAPSRRPSPRRVADDRGSRARDDANAETVEPSGDRRCRGPRTAERRRRDRVGDRPAPKATRLTPSRTIRPRSRPQWPPSRPPTRQPRTAAGRTPLRAGRRAGEADPRPARPTSRTRGWPRSACSRTSTPPRPRRPRRPRRPSDDEIPTIDDDALAARLAGLVPTGGSAAPAPRAPAPKAAATSQVVVTGLVSVASIASFKRHLGRVAGVQSVGVSSGPDGEFVFKVAHGADVVPAPTRSRRCRASRPA